MKVISILLAFINSLIGGILILSCVSTNETLGWITMKSGTGLLAVYFGILTLKDSIAPIRPDRLLLNNILLVIAGVSVVAWGVHWSIVSGDVKNTVLLIGSSLFVQGLASVLGTAGEMRTA
jgi:hypothetical protein